MFPKIRAVVLFVEDFDRCLAFYRDTLGLKVAMLDENSADFNMEDQDLILLKMAAAGKMLGVDAAAFAPRAGGVGRALLCARLGNVDAAYKALTAKGVAFIRPPVDQPWGVRTAYFQDPEGNTWEIAHETEAEGKGQEAV